MIKSCCS